MRKISEYTSSRITKTPKLEVPHRRFTSSVPVELALILSRYNTRFSCLTHSVVCRTPFERVRHKYIERYVYYSRSSPPKLAVADFVNLETYEVVGASSFDFVFLQRCSIKKLKLVEVQGVRAMNLFCAIESISLKRMVIGAGTLLRILKLPSLRGVELCDVRFEYDDGTCMGQVIDAINKLQLHSVKVTVKCAIDLTHKFNIAALHCFRFSSISTHYEFNKSQTYKNKLIMRNCKEALFNEDYTAIRNIKVESQGGVSGLLGSLKVHELRVLDLSNCVFDDGALDRFLGRFDGLEEVHLGGTHIGLEHVTGLIKRFAKTLRVLDLNGVQLNAEIMECARRWLWRCRLVYNDNRKVMINK